MKEKTSRREFKSGNVSSHCCLKLLLIALTFFCFLDVNGEGFRNPPPGAFSLGRAGGRIAQVDDSSAVQQNPANLVDLTNIQAQLAPTVVYISAEFTSPNGQSASSINPWKVLPNFFASMPLENDR